MKKFIFLFFACFIFTSGFLFLPNMVKAEVIYHGFTDLWNGKQETWHSGDVHVLNSDYNIWRGSTLTIEPGVIVKFNSNSKMWVMGTLYAIGNNLNKIYFVSLLDDAVGGDTNGDGSTTKPGIADWKGMIFDGFTYRSVVNGILDYVVIKSGGFKSTYGKITKNNIIYVNKVQSLKIDHSSIVDNIGGILIENSKVSINNSNIYNPSCNYQSEIDACRSYSGLDSYSSIDYDLTNNYWGHFEGPTYSESNTPETHRGVVINKYGTGDLNYLPFAKELFVEWEESVKQNPVILIPGILGSWKIGGQYELDPILNTYDNLWEALKLAGYEEGKTLFAFPYDWRFSNVSNTDDLMRKVQEVKEISGSDNVDIIGHSMGGLLARSYIESTYYNDDVDKLIFLATPHKGAPAAYLMWEGGDLGAGPKNRIKEMVLELEANKNHHEDLFDYVRNDIPSVRDLLPIYDYLKEEVNGQLRSYPNNYPQNYFLELLNKSENMVKLNDINILNITANDRKNDTLNYIKVEDKEFDDARWENGYPHNYDSVFGDHGLELGPGDETVPQMSNDGLFGKEITIFDTSHGDVVTEAQKEVINFLTGKIPPLFVKTDILRKFLIVRIFSPADFLITAPDGKKLGRDDIRQNINEINGAFYYNEDEMEFAVIPNPIEGEYKVDLLGTGDGEYKLSLGYMDEEKNSIKDFKGNISMGENQDFKIDYVSSSDPLSDLKPQDFDAPIIYIANPVSNTPYYRLQKLNIAFNVNDDFSGLATTTLFIDNQLINTTTIDLFDYIIGEHQFKIIASDMVGNVSSSTINFNIITDIENTIKDIEVYYEKKLITIDGKNKLLPPLKQLQLKLLAINYGKERNEIIKSKLDNFNKQLSSLLKQDKINQNIYDIMKADSDYLKINL